MPAPGTKIRAFVVDDEMAISSTLAMILTSQNFEATSFTEPVKALVAAESQTPDILISDLVMPELSGIELATRIRKICPDCKVLLISGKASTADFINACRAIGNAFDILYKPAHPLKVLQAIHRLIAPVPPRQPAFCEESLLGQPFMHK